MRSRSGRTCATPAIHGARELQVEAGDGDTRGQERVTRGITGRGHVEAQEGNTWTHERVPRGGTRE